MNTEKLIRELMCRYEHCQDVAKLEHIADELEALSAYAQARQVRMKMARLAEDWTRVNR